MTSKNIAERFIEEFPFCSEVLNMDSMITLEDVRNIIEDWLREQPEMNYEEKPDSWNSVND